MMFKKRIAIPLIVALGILVSSYVAFSISQWHPAEEIAPGTFGNDVGIGNYTFPANLTVQSNLYVNGSVGIGTSPSYKLDVAGDVRAQGDVIVGGNDILDSSGTARITFSGTNVIITLG